MDKGDWVSALCRCVIGGIGDGVGVGVIQGVVIVAAAAVVAGVGGTGITGSSQGYNCACSLCLIGETNG